MNDLAVPPQAIDYFFRKHPFILYQSDMSLVARRRMLETWLNVSNIAAGDTLIDIGSTPDFELPDSNCIVHWLIERRVNVTLYSPEDISCLSKIIPSAKILKAGNLKHKSIPSGDKSFDWCLASAVIEHVGSYQSQVEFVQDCARVARKGFMITMPNRFHWMEFHTKIPLLHWLPKSMHRKFLKWFGMKLWAQESHLNLVSKAELREIVASAAIANDFDFTFSGVRALGMTSNLILIGTAKKAS